MSAAEQPTLDLGNYRGQNITDTAVKILNQTGGFHPSTEMDEPRIFEVDEELTIAARVKVTDHQIKRILSKKDDDPDRLQLIQTLVMGTVAVIPDTGSVKKEARPHRGAGRRASQEKAGQGCEGGQAQARARAPGESPLGRELHRGGPAGRGQRHGGAGRMRQNLSHDHRVVNGMPAGGYSVGVGINIEWQNGPLGRDEERELPNGAFVEGVIEAALDRLRWYQTASGGRFACSAPERSFAITKLEGGPALVRRSHG